MELVVWYGLLELRDGLEAVIFVTSATAVLELDVVAWGGGLTVDFWKREGVSKRKIHF